MKKKLIILFFMLIFTCQLFPQKLKYGFELGANRTNFAYSKEADYWDSFSKNSISGMAAVKYRFNSYIDIQSGLRYVKLGNIIKYDENIDVFGEPVHVKGSFEIMQNYISIPVRFNIKIPKTPFFISAGPEMGLLFYAKMKAEEQEPEPKKGEEMITADLNLLNYCFNIGLGYNFNLFNKEFYILGLYSYGVKSIPKDLYMPLDWRTREMLLTLGFYL